MSDATIGQPDLVQALLQPTTYPHPVNQIELRQTHISYVFLAGEHAYKIKRPVDFGFLNFSTLARRRYYCHQEVRLNSRLCPEIYIGVIPITFDGAHYRFGGRGRVVEYAVHMMRLPEERMMEHLLGVGAVTDEMVAALADKFADFHARSETGPAIARYGSPRIIGFNWRENFGQTEPFIGTTISRWQFRYLEAYVSAFLKQKRSLLEKRIADGRIRDCHGDLRAAAVCYTNGICVFDCIEFNRRFRYADVASEIAFLAMDLDFRGHHHLTNRFVQRYVDSSGDAEMLFLMDFYECYRAYVRGKVEGALYQSNVDEPTKAKALASARRYFKMACDYASRGRPPLLIAMCGLSGTGKSAVAEALAHDMLMTVVSSDVVRKELAGLRPQERRQEGFRRGIYSRRFTQQTYREMLNRARDLLAHGQSVILDATFSQKQQRALAKKLAKDVGALFFCLEVKADEFMIRERLEARSTDASAISDANWDIYQAQKSAFERVTELDDWEHIIIELGLDLEKTRQDVLEALEVRFSPAGPT